jgi:ATP adenylyltransferase
MAYILSGAELATECIFCAFPAAGRERYREHLILVAQPQAFVIMNRFPYNNGHVMVVPRQHVGDPADLAPEAYDATLRLVRDSTTALRGVLAPQGFNLGQNLGRVAGAGIENHVHWHIVPRWNGDTNFMPVLGEAKVISEHLVATYERLLPAFAALGEGPAPGGA